MEDSKSAIAITLVQSSVINQNSQCKHEENLECESHRPKGNSKSKIVIDAEAAIKDAHFTRKKSKLVCLLCPKEKTFASKTLLNSHFRKVHRESKIIICEICSAKLKSEAYYKRHMETRHPKIQKIFFCDYCGKSFKHKDYLRIHMDRHRIHQILTCTVCQKSYTSRHTFRRHLKMVRMTFFELSSESDRFVLFSMSKIAFAASAVWFSIKNCFLIITARQNTAIIFLTNVNFVRECLQAKRRETIITTPRTRTAKLN